MKQEIKVTDKLIKIILKNDNIELHLLNVGASIFKFIYRGVDIVVGPKKMSDFIKPDHYYGKTVGRFSGRLFTNGLIIGEKQVELPAYKGHATTIHGGKNGYSKRYFTYHQSQDNEAIFTLIGSQKDDGLPGDVTLKVRYTLKADTLLVEYFAVATEKTLINITNHSYFNLDGSKTILDHSLQIDADKYVVFDDQFNVLGVSPVNDTPYDLRKPTQLKKPLNRLSNTAFKGFDNIFLLAEEGEVNLYSPQSKINLNISTSYPSVVVYTHNVSSPDDIAYFQKEPYCGIALECEYEPGGIFYPFLNDAVWDKDENYYHFITYRLNKA